MTALVLRLSTEGEPLPCNLCGAQDPLPLWRVERFSEPIRIVRCRRCGLIFMSPRPAAERLKDLYGEGYFTGEAEFAYADHRAAEEPIRMFFRARLANMARFVERGGLLDVGCSFGIFLDEARRDGWRPVGVDVSEYAAGYARSRFGLDVRTGDLSQAGIEPGSIAAATLIETIEHLPDPRATLERLRDFLRPGGLLVVQTANARSLKAIMKGNAWEWIVLGHLYYFSIGTLRRLLDATGYEPLDVYPGGEFDLRTRIEVARGCGAAGARRVLVVALRHFARRMRAGGLTAGGFACYARRK